MAFEDLDENTGLIFFNKFSEDNEKAPVYKGTINVDGVLKEIALWPKEFKNGEGFSVAIQEPYEADDAKPKGNSRSKPASRGSSSKGSVRPKPRR